MNPDSTIPLDDVKAVLVATLGVEDRADRIDASTPLFGQLPELDSMAVVELVYALEERFGIAIEGEEITAEAFETLGSLATFVAGKLGLTSWASGNGCRELWRLKAGVAVCLMLALIAAVWSLENISLFPPKLTARSLEMATASTHVVVDTPRSTLLDLRQDTYELEALTKRAVLLGNVIANGPVKESIARRAGIPVEVLRVEAPLTAKQPRPRIEGGKEKKASDILRSTDQYRLNIQANPTAPVFDIYAQTPTTESAEALANAAVDGPAGLPRRRWPGPRARRRPSRSGSCSWEPRAET